MYNITLDHPYNINHTANIFSSNLCYFPINNPQILLYNNFYNPQQFFSDYLNLYPNTSQISNPLTQIHQNSQSNG